MNQKWRRKNHQFENIANKTRWSRSFRCGSFTHVLFASLHSWIHLWIDGCMLGRRELSPSNIHHLRLSNNTCSYAWNKLFFFFCYACSLTIPSFQLPNQLWFKEIKNRSSWLSSRASSILCYFIAFYLIRISTYSKICFVSFGWNRKTLNIHEFCAINSEIKQMKVNIELLYSMRNQSSEVVSGPNSNWKLFIGWFVH